MQAATFTVVERYQPRAIRSQGRFDADGWRLKLYSIVYGAVDFDRDVYDEGLNLAASALPRPAQTQSRPGVGFAILHQSRAAHLLVVGWWDRENEYYNRVFQRLLQPDALWRQADDGLTSCVWELPIIHFECVVYVTEVLALSGGRPDLDRYLARYYIPPRAPAPAST